MSQCRKTPVVLRPKTTRSSAGKKRAAADDDDDFEEQHICGKCHKSYKNVEVYFYNNLSAAT